MTILSFEKIRRPACWLAFIVPMALLASSAQAVMETYSAVPFLDQWAIIQAWSDILGHGLTFSYLFSPHNEHRILFPKLVFLADLQWLRGQNILNFTAIGVNQIIGACLFLRVADLRRATSTTILACAFSIALLFSLAQFENFDWGFQVGFVQVFALGGWAIYLFSLATEDRDSIQWVPLVTGSVLLIIATFSLSNGFFAGAATVLTGLLTRGRWKPLATIAAVTGLLAAVYLHGYHAADNHSTTDVLLQKPGAFILYVLAYLGNVWAFGGDWTPADIDRAIAAGALGALLTAAMIVTAVRSGRRDAGRSAMLGLTLFVLITATITAMGRAYYGIGQALASRYATPSVYFWAAQVAFWALTFQAGPRRVPQMALGAICLLGLALLLPIQKRAYPEIMLRHSLALIGSSAMLSIDDDSEALSLVYPQPALAQALTPFLRAHHLSLFAWTDGYPAGSAFRPRPAPNAANCLGSIDVIDPGPAGFWRIQGWSWDKARNRPFANLQLVDSTNRVVGVALTGMERPDIAARLNKRSAALAGWIASVDRNAKGELQLYALHDGETCYVGAKTMPARLAPPAADFLKNAVVDPSACRGALDAVQPQSTGQTHATGWGWDKANGRVITNVILTDEAKSPLGAGDGGYPRFDVAQVNHEVNSGFTGWEADISRPAGGKVIAYGEIDAHTTCELGRLAWPQ
jgi:hypothetical protein